MSCSCVTEWFAVANLLGRPFANRLRHVKFGVMLIWSEEKKTWVKTASRNGGE